MPFQLPTPAPPPPTAPAAKNLFDDGTFSTEFGKVKGGFDEQLKVYLDNREIRRPKVDLERMRNDDELQDHETYIAPRVIHEAIRNDLPNYLQYLKGSDRFTIFLPPVGVEVITEPLEKAFTTALRYDNWEEAFLRWIDSTKLHGIGWMECRFDPKRAYRVSNEYIRIDHLIVDPKVDDIQKSKIVGRQFDFTSVMLEEYVTNGTFDKTATAPLLEKAAQGNNPLQVIFKVWFKEGGIVYCAWWSDEAKVYLRKPRPYYNGVDVQSTVRELVPGTFQTTERVVWQPRKECCYPIRPFYDSFGENAELQEQEGYGQQNFYMQEAETALMTAYTNQHILASRTIWTPRSNGTPYETKAAAQRKFVLKNNHIWDTAMEAVNPPSPDEGGLKFLQYMDNRASSANGQIAFTVQNRKDSKKTATETNEAAKMNAQINSANVLYFSMALKGLFSAAWEIIQSQALQGLIDLKIDPAILGLDYVLQAAGDVDVIRKADTIQSMQRDWPLISATPAGQIFAEDYLTLVYPERAAKYIAAMKAGNPLAALLQGTANVLKEIITDEHGQLIPSAQPHAAQLQQLAAAIQAALATSVGGVAAGNQNSQPPAQPAGGPSAQTGAPAGNGGNAGGA